MRTLSPRARMALAAMVLAESVGNLTDEQVR